MIQYRVVPARGTTCSRQYGYTLELNPPKTITIHGDDIEGIGWWEYRPPKVRTLRHLGWYKYKSDAVRRAEELNQ
jgi:hypothetical protein